mmetsp:Transcript_5484/g.8523  ORF Transcript_5484/g.8523 Transcript_5484/m.8523 type:complete len:94 (+) Transcript_5484:177-458(+)
MLRFIKTISTPTHQNNFYSGSRDLGASLGFRFLLAFFVPMPAGVVVGRELPALSEDSPVAAIQVSDICRQGFRVGAALGPDAHAEASVGMFHC